MSNYKYRAFGLSINSEIKMDELIEVKSQVSYDVNIKFGKVPVLKNEILFENENVNITKTEFVLNVPEVAKYYVQNGKEIIVEQYEKSNIKNVKLFVLGSCFGAVLMQRKSIPLHGAAVNVKGKCVLILGGSGAGKSSLSAGFVEKGYRILSDDVIAITIQNNEYYAHPSYPQQKLSYITLNELNIDKSEYIKVDYMDEREKYYIPRRDQFEKNKMKIEYIIDLRKKDILSVEINELKGINKIGLLKKNTYRAFLLKYCDLLKNQFINFSKIATQAKFYMISRPENIYTVDKQIEIIEKLIEIERVNKCKTE